MERQHLSQELADEYAIGSLEPETERVVRLHAADCESCTRLLREAERYAAALALGVGLSRPRADLKERVMLESGIVRPSPLRRGWTVARAFGGVAALLLAAGTLAGLLGLRSQVTDLERENSALESQVHDLLTQGQQLTDLTDRVANAEALASDLYIEGKADRDLLIAQLSPETQVADVVGVNGYEGAIGRLVWDETQQRVWFVATRLPRRAEGETYELWVSAGGRWISLGTFNPDQTGYARMESFVPLGLRGYESAVVTIEATGSVERRGPSVFVMDLSPFRR